MLCSMYKTVSIYREESDADAWGNTDKQDNWQLDHTELMFIQPKGGSFTNTNQRQTASSSHVGYCSVDVDIVNGDRILYNSLYYQVTFIQPNIGIGGIGDHQEIDLDVLDDMP